jgi:UDPglucose 6-dehydrogenase
MNIAIIGYGVVGKNLLKEFPDADIADPALGFTLKQDAVYEIAFVCVPTNKMYDGSADISLVKQVVKEYADQVTVFVIKSTVPPGTTESLDHSCVFSPEYYGATVHANDPDYNFVILGGDLQHTTFVAEFYKRIKPSSWRIWKTDSRTAEWVKYMENFWIGTKVTFVNAFSQMAELDGVDPDVLRELWLQDPRINRSHTFSFSDQPYYDSHCLNKDMPAILAYALDRGYDAQFLEAVIDENHRMRRLYRI